MTVQADSSSEPPLEYNLDQTPVANQGLVMTCLTNVGVIGRLCSFRLVLERRAGKELSELSRFVLKKVFCKQFCFISSRRQPLRAVE